MAFKNGEKHSLENAKFSFVPEGFSYQGTLYPYAKIASVGLHRTVLHTHVVAVGTDQTHAIAIAFVTKDGARLQITEQPTLLRNSRIDRVEEVQKIFDVVSHHTFQQRLLPYIKQINAEACFTYASWNFSTSSRTIRSLDGRLFQIDETDFQPSHGALMLAPHRDRGTGGWIKRQIGGKVLGVYTPPAIATIYDADVLYALLSHYFGKRWH